MRWDTHHTENNSRIIHIYRKGRPDLANENWASSLLLFFSISCFRNRYSASEIIMFVKNVSHWSVALIKICIYTRHISQLYCSLAEEWLLLESVGGWAIELELTCPDLGLLRCRTTICFIAWILLFPKLYCV